MSINKEVHGIIKFLQGTLAQSGCNGFALGMSGGIDSAVCAALANRAVTALNEQEVSFYNQSMWDHPERNYTLDLICLPIHSHESDLETAIEVIESLGMEGRAIDLTKTYQEFIQALSGTPGDHKASGNLKARMRMSAIYWAANVNNLLVLGTDNLSETYTGYFTKHGDGAADVFPISNYTKREVYEIGRFLGLPESVLTRKPSAGLWEGQTDESEMGIPYDYIDNHIEGLGDLNVTTYLEEHDTYYVKLENLHRSTQHKRNPPHVYGRK
jgi:NAD+ synthase